MVAIDDLSSERALERLKMEDLSRSPGLVSQVPGTVLKALSALVSGDISGAADLFAKCQESLESERSG